MSTTTMSPDEIRQTVDAQRTAFADQLGDLGEPEWSRPSLCADWIVREVVAHMSLNQTTAPRALAQLARYGNVNRIIRETARRKAVSASTEELTAQIRSMVGTRRAAPFVTHCETLIDVLVHSQDAMVPLNRVHRVPPEAAAVAAGRVVSTPFFEPSQRLAGLELRAVDIEWAYGTGADVAVRWMRSC